MYSILVPMYALCLSSNVCILF